MNRSKIVKVVKEALRQANLRNDGDIVIQLHPNNRSFVISWQFGNSWESMGLDAIESEKRILASFTCQDEYNNYDEDWFYEHIDRISNEIENNFVSVS